MESAEGTGILSSFAQGISGRLTAQGYEIDRKCSREIVEGISESAERGGLAAVG